MSSMFSSLLGQTAPPTDTEEQAQKPTSNNTFSSLVTPQPSSNTYSSIAAQPVQDKPELPAVAPAVGAGSGMFSSLVTPNTPAEKYSADPVLTNTEVKYGQKSPDEMEDEPWYSKAWEWMNSPLYDLHQWGTREGAGAFEKGLETGLEDIGSGFTSPLQIGLTLATFGGGAVEEAGVSVLGAIGVSKAAAPIVASTAKLAM